MSNTNNEDNVHDHCLAVIVGMNYREALAIMRREPDSTLSGHTTAGPDGDPPAGSYAVDFWNSTGADGQPRISALRYSGGIIESTDCGRPKNSHGTRAPAQDN